MINKSFKIVGIGEILWDMLPEGRQLGGAPANFAYIANALGNHGIILSRIGGDQAGTEILGELKAKQLTTKYIQIDPQNPTGTVDVKLENGQPSYTINEDVAWDYLELSEEWLSLIERVDAVCYGSLAQRSKISQKTIRLFVSKVKGLRIFDVNLRQNYFSKSILGKSINLANVVKMNHEELPVIAETFEIEIKNPVQAARELLEKFQLNLICITRGGNGSLLISKKDVSEHRGVKAEIADTIGAGDAFTAAMTHGLLRRWHISQVNAFANRVGAFVASKTGAMPEIPREVRK